MTDYIRRLVSGNKARFKDNELGLELDLVYVTDQIIIMGYPASGFEGYYRNKREDAKKFLDSKHGKSYWIFNFCPLGENSYDPEFFEGRVSRYPFPDHHAPPLAILPLVAREMRAWLSGSPERVAVLHCKAGKGRSGTMACAYLVAVHNEPTPSIVQRSQTEKEWVGQRVEETIDALPEDQEITTDGSALASPPSSINPAPRDEETSFTEALKGVLELHTSRRMKAPSSPSEKQKQGVSIPSQRRFLYYWALCLASEAPAGFWSLGSIPAPLSINFSLDPSTQKQVKMTEIKIRFRELSNVKAGLLKAANFVIEKGSSKGKNHNAGSSQVWASLARYDDEFVSTLERWEKYSRDENGKIGIRRPGSEHMDIQGKGEERLAAMFSDGKWDSHKMVRTFGRMGEIGAGTGRVQTREDDMGKRITTYTLHPLTNQSWEGIRKDIINTSPSEQIPQVDTEDYGLPSYENSFTDGSVSRPRTLSGISNDGILKSPKLNEAKHQDILLNAEREVRIKLYIGQVFMGWIWLIPAFHMPHPPPTMQDTNGTMAQTIRLSRKDIDFPIGLGAGIIDVEISLEWVMNHAVQPNLKEEEKGWDISSPGVLQEMPVS